MENLVKRLEQWYKDGIVTEETYEYLLDKLCRKYGTEAVAEVIIRKGL